MWKNYVKRTRCMRKVLVTLMLTSVVLSGYGLTLSSTALKENGFIPRVYTCQGENYSLPLSWSRVPHKTQSFVLFMTDPGTRAMLGYSFVHWVTFDLPVSATELRENSALGIPGMNSRRTLGYTGPCPPQGPPHHYVLQLYALDVSSLDLPEGATIADVRQAMQGHVLAYATLLGFYKRIESDKKGVH